MFLISHVVSRSFCSRFRHSVAGRKMACFCFSIFIWFSPGFYLTLARLYNTSCLFIISKYMQWRGFCLACLRFERHCHLDRLVVCRERRGGEGRRWEKERERRVDEGRSGSLSVTRIEACYWLWKNTPGSARRGARGWLASVVDTPSSSSEPCFPARVSWLLYTPRLFLTPLPPASP